MWNSGLYELAGKVEVNPEATDLTARTDLSLRGPAGKILPQLVKLLQDE
jgi:hypothetical protein